PSSTLFPYTTLFRSAVVIELVDREFDSAHDGFIQWRLDAGEAQASPDNDFRAVTLDLWRLFALRLGRGFGLSGSGISPARTQARSEEHTSELQSRFD